MSKSNQIKAMMSVGAGQLEKSLEILISRGLVPFVKSSPGRGKSAIISSFTENQNLLLVDIRLSMYEPQDFSGLPFRDGDWSRFLPFADFLPLEGTALPVERDASGNITHRYDGWLVLLDEFTHAEPEMIRASYKLILDRMVGQNKLHERVAVVLAGNSSEDNALANNVGTALNSRVTHIELKSDPDYWMQYVAPKLDIDHRIVGFIAHNKDKLNDFDPEQDEHSFCSERTWEFVSKLIKDDIDVPPVKAPLVAGTISPGVAAEFLKFCEIYLTLNSLDDILKNPTTIDLPDNSQKSWATVTWLTRQADSSNVDAIAQYISRMSIQFSVIFIRLLDRKLITGTSPALMSLLTRVGKAI